MKYDDASWHSGGQFPEGSPAEYGGTHIALLLKWCVLKGWAGQLHKGEGATALGQLMHGEISATDFLFEFCDGKLTDEDLDDQGNAFVSVYYGDHGDYLNDYADNFGELMYVASEGEHDFRLFSSMVDARYNAFVESQAGL
ncbi:DUF7832 domain-containing protein [Dyella soli]|uniref:DUF7832 domain-containing protein n=1 Tax=Dyella soli TaxID=522319 RepID=A0A4R0YE92_9GAMM|nr:hypothetical protein [Dyella soli]TCI06368.1 hypothetical protein EZM97_33315 [Dyella soli]